MRKRILHLILLTAFLSLLGMSLLLLLYVGVLMPQQFSDILRCVVGCLIIVTPVVVIVATLQSEAETRKITNPLNAMDLNHPERTPLDKELKPFSENLRRQNAIITDQMNHIQEQSASRESRRREFTANVSHELKTPLTTISGTAEILRSGIVKPEDVPHFADNIYRESQRMITLVSDILRLSRLEDPWTSEEKTLVDLYSITRQNLDWLQDSAAQHKVTLSLTGTHARVYGVDKTLNEMVYNLCDNAIKYNRPGGWVKVTVRDSNGQVRLTVKDTGIGIPEEHHERIFERFYRVDKSHSRDIGGTGLGLSIVKHGAIAHGAQVQLRSSADKGTAITLIFPAPKPYVEIPPKE